MSGNDRRASPHTVSDNKTVSFGCNFTQHVDILVYPEQYHHWLKQICACATEAGLLNHLENKAQRPVPASMKQVNFDKERAVLNNLIFDSVGVKLKDEVAQSLNQNLGVARPADVIRAVRLTIISPAFYYHALDKFMQFRQLYDSAEDPVFRLRLLHRDWDFLKACEMGTSDDVYVSVVRRYLERTPYAEGFRVEVTEHAALGELTAEYVRTWLRYAFRVPEL
ncbi:hypothetical protein PLIIFM63780_009406 [Purpureocillium lilacinum]|uniref:uncharacterized protein n=1 Tax=Purpureocillium lilacinum TaxID=33203 RepID=UPI002080C61A|nr:hypothetical protein PLICBS_009485 [Purpureocillium lilacinum]GJN85832.1 hypothetical protein PLIIFM63780_009406 [Purpureocillium lilacinum]